MNAEEAIAYLENAGWSATRLGLGRTHQLLRGMGDPQKKLRFIHVAGSNGKGSTCAMFSSILRAAGYRTGLYISPYLESFYERIQINGKDIEPERLAALTERVRAVAEEMEDHPSQFELVTAVAMTYWAEESCDIVVLEVGMGGALDSTNVIDAPELAVITNIGLEHTEYLGNTLEEIALTKAGIIKPGSLCVCYDGAEEVTGVVRRVCREQGVPLRCSDFTRLSLQASGLDGQRFTWDGEEYRLPLLGAHQLHNAALVLTGTEALCERGWKIGREQIRRGLGSVRWPARLEVLSRDPLFILDGGHNPQCAEALAGSLAELLPGQKPVFLMGILRDKDAGAVIETIRPYVREAVCVRPESDRALEEDRLAAMLLDAGIPARSAPSIEEGLDLVLSTGEPAVAFGSLYLAGHLRKIFPGRLKRFQRRECLAARKGLPDAERGRAAARICRRLAELPEIRSARTILAYAAAGGEPDLRDFLAWCASNGKTVAFPAVTGDGEMDAMIPRDSGSWETGAFGISAPVPERSERLVPEDLDAVIVPCVGFDGDCRRLGHGGGYYDRFLPRTAAVRVGTAFEAQKRSEIAAEATDQKLSVIVTEETVYRGK